MTLSTLKLGGVLTVLAAGLSGCVAYYPADPYPPGPAYAPPPVAYAPPVVYGPPAYGAINLNFGGGGYYGHRHYGGYRHGGYRGHRWR